MISAEQIRQFIYCPRKIYWRDIACIPRPPSFLMDQGKKFHEKKTVRAYVHKDSLATYREFYMKSEIYLLKGIADAIVEYKDHLTIIEYKQNIPQPIPEGYLLQICALAILAEEHFGKAALLLEFRTHSGRRLGLPIDEKVKKRTLETLELVHELISSGEFPQSCGIPVRCLPCEYNNICSTDL